MNRALLRCRYIQSPVFRKRYVHFQLCVMLLIYSSCLGKREAIKSLATAVRYLDSLSSLENPASSTSPLLGSRSVYVFECLSDILAKPFPENSNSSISECGHHDTLSKELTMARTTLQRACLSSDAFSFRQQIELLLMLRSELLKGRLSRKMLLSEVHGNESYHQIQLVRFIAEVEGKEELSVEQSSFISKVSPILRRLFGEEASLVIVGSSACGLGSVQSDLDMTILVRHHSATSSSSGNKNIISPVSRKQGNAALLSLAKSLRFQHGIPAFAVLGARVPVVRVCDRSSGLVADISLENRAAVAHTQLLRVFAAIDPRVRPLVLVVKAWARRRRINNASAGTLSSFALTLLVIHFLQVTEPPVLPCLFEPALRLRGNALRRFRSRHGADAEAVLVLPALSYRTLHGVGTGTVKYLDGEARTSGDDKKGMSTAQAQAEKEKAIDSRQIHGQHAAEEMGPERVEMGGGVVYHCDTEILEGWGSDNKLGVSELARDFFAYVALADHGVVHCLSVRTGRRVPAHDMSAPAQRAAGMSAQGVDDGAEVGAGLWLEDPLDASYNVARHVRGPAWRRVLAEFMRAYCLCAAGAPIRRLLLPALPPPAALVSAALRKRQKPEPRFAVRGEGVLAYGGDAAADAVVAKPADGHEDVQKGGQSRRIKQEKARLAMGCVSILGRRRGERRDETEGVCGGIGRPTPAEIPPSSHGMSGGVGQGDESGGPTAIIATRADTCGAAGNLQQVSKRWGVRSGLGMEKQARGLEIGVLGDVKRVDEENCLGWVKDHGIQRDSAGELPPAASSSPETRPAAPSHLPHSHPSGLTPFQEPSSLATLGLATPLVWMRLPLTLLFHGPSSPT